MIKIICTFEEFQKLHWSGMPRTQGKRGSLGNSGWNDVLRSIMISKDLTEQGAEDKDNDIQERKHKKQTNVGSK